MACEAGDLDIFVCHIAIGSTDGHRCIYPWYSVQSVAVKNFNGQEKT